MYADLCEEVAGIIATEMYTEDFEKNLNSWLQKYWQQKSQLTPVAADQKTSRHESGCKWPEGYCLCNVQPVPLFGG